MSLACCSRSRCFGGPGTGARIDSSLDLAAVGEGELSRRGDPDLRKLRAGDACTFTVPLITKQPALRADGIHANYGTSKGWIGDVERASQWVGGR